MKKHSLSRYGMGLLALAAVLCSCGPKVDYTKANYTELKASQNWVTKEGVKYQYLNDRLEGFGAYWPVCLNLYSDGSAASWQATVTSAFVNHVYDDSKHVTWQFLGNWTMEGNAIHLHMRGETVSVFFAGPNTTTDAPDDLSYDFTLTDGKGTIGTYVLLSSAGTDLTTIVADDGTVHFATLNAFYESYKDDYQVVTTPAA
jgi:hypothetical protein